MNKLVCPSAVYYKKTFLYIYFVFRYGAFVFGNNRSFIPKDFGKKSPPLFRKVAVKNAAQVGGSFYFKFPKIYILYPKSQYSD